MLDCYYSYELRIVVVGQGSIPWLIIVLMALFLSLVAVQKANLELTTALDFKSPKGVFMNTNVFGFALSQTLWAIGTSIIAGALPS